ncbi:hypothetical protein [Haloglycomyces albus]|uniref:hypothetical protein n=1 Tax=Haloglycomyces albus TaxID=526067 RepID=UPI00046CA6E2|nr:hypothetical protein [Haloglycomyces albus]
METEQKSPTRDRLGIHLVWEIALFLCAAGLLFALTRSGVGPFSETGWSGFAAALLPLLLGTAGMALSLRVSTVNLAIGPIALFSGWLFVDASASGTVLAIGMALGAAFFLGLTSALLNAWLRIPGWATSIGIGGSLILLSRSEPGVFHLDALGNNIVYLALGATVVFTLGLATIGAFAGIRARLEANRETPDGQWRPHPWLLGSGIIASFLLAGAAGVVFSWSGSNAETATLINPWELSLMALGAALLGGTSVYGRRGGFAGTFLGAVVVLSSMWFLEDRGWFNPLWIPVGAIVFGFVLTRVVEVWNSAEDSDDEVAERAGDIDDLKADATTILPGGNSGEETKPTSMPTSADPVQDNDFAAMANGTGVFDQMPGEETNRR